jgi:ferredoxin-NADP reductase
MIMNEFTVKVIELIQCTPTAATLRMEKPDGFTFKPGQWGYFTIERDGAKVSRSLSFSSSPTEPYLEFTKRISSSDFCRTVEQLQQGDEISFRGPMGNLIYEGGLNKVTFLAGGIGITPIRSILKYAVDRGINGDKYLLYGNLNMVETAFADEIEQWKREDPGLKVTHVLNDPPQGWDGFTGFIDSRVIEASVPNLSDQTFFVSGPPPMVNAVTGCLDELGVHRDRVFKEELQGYEGMV